MGYKIVLIASSIGIGAYLYGFSPLVSFLFASGFLWIIAVILSWNDYPF